VFFNIIIGRAFLVNWNKQFLYGICIIAISYFAYEKIIITKENLLPDFSNIANELWIIILVFLYTLINNIPTSNSGAEKRKLEYIKSIHKSVDEKYSKIIDPIINRNIRLRQIIFAIIIHENFNRPKAYRIIEVISGFISSKDKTYGIMQVRSKKPISDKESVELGSKIILENFQKLIPEYEIEINEKENKSSYYTLEYIDSNFQEKLVRSYNHCDDYTYDIIQLADYINENFYNNKEENKLLFASV